MLSSSLPVFTERVTVRKEGACYLRNSTQELKIRKFAAFLCCVQNVNDKMQGTANKMLLMDAGSMRDLISQI